MIIRFESNYGKRDKPHYVAKLTYGENGLLYHFATLDKTYDAKETYVIGEYAPQNNEVWDIRDKNGRFIYLMYNDMFLKLGKGDEARILHAVKWYLRFNESPETLLEIVGLKEIHPLPNVDLLDD